MEFLPKCFWGFAFFWHNFKMYAMCAPMCTRVSLSSPNLREFAIFLPEWNSWPNLFCLRNCFLPIQVKGKKAATQHSSKIPSIPSPHRLSIAARWMALASCSFPSGRQRWATSHATSSEAWRQNAKAKGTPKTPGLIGGKHPRFFGDSTVK